MAQRTSRSALLSHGCFLQIPAPSAASSFSPRRLRASAHAVPWSASHHSVHLDPPALAALPAVIAIEGSPHIGPGAPCTSAPGAQSLHREARSPETAKRTRLSRAYAPKTQALRCCDLFAAHDVWPCHSQRTCPLHRPEAGTFDPGASTRFRPSVLSCLDGHVSQLRHSVSAVTKSAADLLLRWQPEAEAPWARPLHRRAEHPARARASRG